MMPIYHLVKCEDRVGGWGIQIMQYLIKILPKEAADILNNCGTDGHATLQLIHLQLHTLHFLFQIDECCVISVQGTKGFAKYTSGVKYYWINIALVYDQVEDPDDEHTQDVLIFKYDT